MQSTRPAPRRFGDRRSADAAFSSLAACNSIVVRGFVIFTLATSACGPRESTIPTAPPIAGRTLGAVFQTLENPFFREVNEGLREVVESNGDTLQTRAADWNGPRQQDDIERLIAGGVAALFVNPVDPDLIEKNLRHAANAGIPCVVVDTQMPQQDTVGCQVLSDNREAGRLAARSLAKAQQSGRIVVLHIPVNQACIDRIAGFREVLSHLPEITILAVADGGGTREAAKTAMDTLLKRFPDLDGVFAANDPMALGAIAALERAGRTAPVVSVDGSPEGIAAVQTGRLHSTTMQFPREIGRIAAQRTYEILQGNAVEHDIRVPVELVTKENAHAFVTAQP